jgi:formylglycine-generating enzyme required for sulfatase activity
MMTIKSHYYTFILPNVLLVTMLLLIIGDCNSKTDESYKNKESNIIHPSRGDSLINSFGIALIYIPAGEFMMGSRETPEEVVNTEGGKVEWYRHEHAIHRVKISKGFYMGMTEITQEQYQAVMHENPSKYKGDNLPVENVT